VYQARCLRTSSERSSAAVPEFAERLVDVVSRQPDDPVGDLDAVLQTAIARLRTTLSCRPPLTHPSLLQSRPSAFERRPLEFFQDAFGFVPKVFQAQASRPDVLEAEAFAIDTVLLSAGALSRMQKECVLIAVSAAHQNTYGVTLHSEFLRMSGADEDVADQIASDYSTAEITAADKALLDFAVAVGTNRPVRADDVERLRAWGFSDSHVWEAAAVTSLAVFLNALETGLGVEPDFVPRVTFPAATPARNDNRGDDPDLELVDRAREGDVNAFEELVRRHHRRLFRAVLGVTQNYEDAEDVAQIAFVKAFQGLAGFERHSRFTTWLTRIAINEALSRVRSRKPVESLSAEVDDREEFRPAIVEAWAEDPERLYQREELRTMIERALSGLPVKYRMPVLLRDVEQLSTTDAASALGLPVPTLKKHLLKGRLMLREALAPHFTPRRGAVARV